MPTASSLTRSSGNALLAVLTLGCGGLASSATQGDAGAGVAEASAPFTPTGSALGEAGDTGDHDVSTPPDSRDDSGACPVFDAGPCPTFDAGACSATVSSVALASSQNSPQGIAVDSMNVYWESSGAVWAVPVGGGTSMTVAKSATLSSARNVVIAVDASNVYWSNASTVMSAPKAGGPATLVATAPADAPESMGGYTIGLNVSASAVIWGWGWGALKGPYGGSVVSAPLAGGSAAVLLNEPYALEAMAADDANVYAAGSSIVSVPIGGGPAMPVGASGQFPRGIAVDDANIYWTSWDSGTGRVMKAPKHGCGATTLACGSWAPGPIASDATSLYWAALDNDGIVMKVPTGGGDVTTLACQPNPNPSPSGYFWIPSLTVDAANVYWVNAGYMGSGAVMKTPK